MRTPSQLFMLISTLVFSALQSSAQTPPVRFGVLADGSPVDLYTLTNEHGMEARIMTYGGILVSLKVPDSSGNLADVVLGFDSLDQYVKQSPYFGAIVGRYANRIAKGKFTLEGKEYTLAINNGANSLHGGLRGFDKVVWKAVQESNLLSLTYVSGDGEEGYPGTLSVKVIYKLSKDNILRIDYVATTDNPTVLNLSHHSYFNLAGAGEGDVLGHLLTINADAFTPVDAGLIPTGELRKVKGTPFDFSTPTAIGARINQDDDQLKKRGGYDHNFVLNKSKKYLTEAARVEDPASGRVMEVWTTEPGLQFYTGNFLGGNMKGKGGKTYAKRGGFCLETQHFPDSPNHPEFPSTELKPGNGFHSVTEFRFSTKK
jgi:aldose 1-epimerase